MEVQWLTLAFQWREYGQGARIPHSSGPKHQNIKQKQYCNTFNKDFKKMVHTKNIFKKYILEGKKKEY